VVLLKGAVKVEDVFTFLVGAGIRATHHRDDAVGSCHSRQVLRVLKPQGVLVGELGDLIQQVAEVASGRSVGEEAGLSHGCIVSDEVGSV